MVIDSPLLVLKPLSGLAKTWKEATGLRLKLDSRQDKA